MKNPKPEPVVVTTLCSLCNERWEAHGDDPSTLDCIRLLRAELARRPRYDFINAPAPRWDPPVMPWQNPVICEVSGQKQIGHGWQAASSSGEVTYMTPKDVAA